MTIEQAKSELMQIYGALSPDKQRAIDTLIKIEPCEDAISRQAVLDINESYHGQMPNRINHQIWQEIKDLPSVNPQEPKTGHWISVNTGNPSCIKDGMVTESVRCSECDEWLTASDEYACYGRYCPNCGAKMEE